MSDTRTSQAGMTLVEALMAVFIMGLASALIVLTLPTRESNLEMEAKRLTEVVDTARTRALVSGQWTGIELGKTGYQQVTYRDGRWAGSYRRTHELARGVTLDLTDPPKRSSKLIKIPPVFQFGPTGASVSKPLILKSASGEVTVSLTPNGDIRMEGGNG